MRDLFTGLRARFPGCTDTAAKPAVDHPVRPPQLSANEILQQGADATTTVLGVPPIVVDPGHALSRAAFLESLQETFRYLASKRTATPFMPPEISAAIKSELEGTCKAMRDELLADPAHRPITQRALAAIRRLFAALVERLRALFVMPDEQPMLARLIAAGDIAGAIVMMDANPKLCPTKDDREKLVQNPENKDEPAQPLIVHLVRRGRIDLADRIYGSDMDFSAAWNHRNDFLQTACASPENLYFAIKGGGHHLLYRKVIDDLKTPWPERKAFPETLKAWAIPCLEWLIADATVVNALIDGFPGDQADSASSAAKVMAKDAEPDFAAKVIAGFEKGGRPTWAAMDSRITHGHSAPITRVQLAARLMRVLVMNGRLDLADRYLEETRPFPVYPSEVADETIDFHADLPTLYTMVRRKPTLAADVREDTNKSIVNYLVDNAKELAGETQPDRLDTAIRLVIQSVESVAKDRKPAVKNLLSEAVGSLGSPLLYAARKGAECRDPAGQRAIGRVCQALLRHLAAQGKFSITDHHNHETLLHLLAASSDSTVLDRVLAALQCGYSSDGQKAIGEQQIADAVHRADAQGRTPIMRAIQARNYPQARLMIALGKAGTKAGQARSASLDEAYKLAEMAFQAELGKLDRLLGAGKPEPSASALEPILQAELGKLDRLLGAGKPEPSASALEPILQELNALAPLLAALKAPYSLHGVHANILACAIPYPGMLAHVIQMQRSLNPMGAPQTDDAANPPASNVGENTNDNEEEAIYSDIGIRTLARERGLFELALAKVDFEAAGLLYCFDDLTPERQRACLAVQPGGQTLAHRLAVMGTDPCVLPLLRRLDMSLAQTALPALDFTASNDANETAFDILIGHSTLVAPDSTTFKMLGYAVNRARQSDNPAVDGICKAAYIRCIEARMDRFHESVKACDQLAAGTELKQCADDIATIAETARKTGIALDDWICKAAYIQCIETRMDRFHKSANARDQQAPGAELKQCADDIATIAETARKTGIALDDWIGARLPTLLDNPEALSDWLTVQDQVRASRQQVDASDETAGPSTGQSAGGHKVTAAATRTNTGAPARPPEIASDWEIVRAGDGRTAALEAALEQGKYRAAMVLIGWGVPLTAAARIELLKTAVADPALEEIPAWLRALGHAEEITANGAGGKAYNRNIQKGTANDGKGRHGNLHPVAHKMADIAGSRLQSAINRRHIETAIALIKAKVALPKNAAAQAELLNEDIGQVEKMRRELVAFVETETPQDAHPAGTPDHKEGNKLVQEKIVKLGQDKDGNELVQEKIDKLGQEMDRMKYLRLLLLGHKG